MILFREECGYYENHSLTKAELGLLLRKEDDFGSLVRKREADDEEIVDIGEGFSFLARLFKIY